MDIEMNIGIVGLGLIGGCLGIDFKALGHRVFGVARRAETATEAIALEAVDEAGIDLSLLTRCEVVFICTPIATIVPMVSQLASVLSAGVPITDVGSVKTAIVEAATERWPDFVGGHPMSGKSEAGLAAADPQIFKSRPYVITPIHSTNPKSAQIVESLATQLGSTLYHCTPEDHDRAVAWISHLPVMVSASLIHAALREPDQAVLDLAQQLASSGFRDTSRVGGGNAELGLMMAQYNQSELLRALKRYQQEIELTISQVESSDWPAIAQKLKTTSIGRSQFVLE